MRASVFKIMPPKGNGVCISSPSMPSVYSILAIQVTHH